MSTTETPTSGLAQTPELSADSSGNITYTAPAKAMERLAIKRGRHPDVTPGAFGGKRKDNGINYRTSKLIRAFR
jgi:hypothetical protein